MQYTNNSDYFVIPNPIYDVVFRYLMKDKDSAIIILSTIIGEKIKDLNFLPLTFPRKLTFLEHQDEMREKVDKLFEIEKQRILSDDNLSEYDKNIAINDITIVDPVSGRDIKLFHLDFAATIEKANGEEEVVMIELQKAFLENDIFRFKQYICENFQRKRRIQKVDADTGLTITIDLPFRLIPIFILNFKIETEINDLMIKTRRISEGVFTTHDLNKQNDFIDHLSYDLYVVQLPYLQEVDEESVENDEYRQKLYSLLKLFDQNSKKEGNNYRLLLFKRFFPKFLDRVIKRLQAAAAENPNLEKQMAAEDLYLTPLINRDNKISWLLSKKKEMEETLEEKNKVLEEKDKALEAKDKQLALGQKKIIDTAKLLLSLGTDVEKIAEATGLSVSEIKNIK